MGWARAELLYDRLKLKEDLSPIQEALVLLVHLRKKRIQMKELEILAIGAINEANQKTIISMVESYHNLVHPGTNPEQKTETEAAELLAKESRKVFAVRPAVNPAEAAKQMAQDPRLAQLSSHYLKNKKIFEHQRMMEKATERKK